MFIAIMMLATRHWHYYFLSLFLATHSIIEVLARLEAALILPHGDEALDPRIQKEGTLARQAADAIANAAYTAGEWLASLELDVLFLSSPHGIALSTDFAVFLNDVGSGSVSIGSQTNSISAYTITVPSVLLAPELANQLINDLRNENINNNVTGLSSPDGKMPLYWGELIPLLLTPTFRNGESNMDQRYLRTTTNYASAFRSMQQQRQHLIWTHPLRRYHEAANMLDELLRLGSFLGEWLERRPERIGVIISGDLSHTHRADGPYGYSPTSASMDAALGSWASSPCDQAQDLLKTAAALQSRALSCGFTGMVLLHGMLCPLASTKNTTNARPSFRAQVLVNRNVTYYGMMVAKYSREQ